MGSQASNQHESQGKGCKPLNQPTMVPLKYETCITWELSTLDLVDSTTRTNL